MTDNRIDWKKYLIVLFITAGIFFVASFASSYLSNKKLGQLKGMQDKISIDILSSETQFSLLSSLSCKNVSDSVLSRELDEYGQKLDWSQQNLDDSDEISYLRKYYSLLEIKDYLLMKQISARCGGKSAFILYFYTTAENCTLCQSQGQVLSALRDKYPELRVYSFDYSTDLSAVKAMLQIYKIKDTVLPALVIDDDVLTGFHPIEHLESRVKESFKLQEKTTPAGEEQAKKSL